MRWGLEGSRAGATVRCQGAGTAGEEGVIKVAPFVPCKPHQKTITSWMLAACIPSTLGADTEESQVPGQPGQFSKTPSQSKKGM